MAATPLPPFVFRIDEICPDPNLPPTSSNRADWVPSLNPDANISTNSGASGIWYAFNGSNIVTIPPGGFPQGTRPYHTYSMYYLGGFGFWVLLGDARTPAPGVTWQPLRFEHQTNYSSYLCNAAQSSTLAVRRADQGWLNMLLPDIYFRSATPTPYPQYGALRGELGIFLALIAFAIHPVQLQALLPHMLTNGVWQLHQGPDGRLERRGVVVQIHTWPPHSSETKLAAFETKGCYFT